MILFYFHMDRTMFRKIYINTAKILIKHQDELTSNYIKLIQKFTDGSYYKIRPIISCVFPIPQNINSKMCGSKEDRITYTLYMNEKLKYLCCQNNIPFFDIYDLLHENNIISSTVVDHDETHVDRKNIELRKIIEDKLKELINNNYGIKI